MLPRTGEMTGGGNREDRSEKRKRKTWEAVNIPNVLEEVALQQLWLITGRGRCPLDSESKGKPGLACHFPCLPPCSPSSPEHLLHVTGLHQGQRQGPPTSPFWLGEKGDRKPRRVSGMDTKTSNTERRTEEGPSKKTASGELRFGGPSGKVEGAPGRGNSKGNGSGEEPHCNLRQRKEATELASYCCGLCGKKQAWRSGPTAQWARRLGFI